MIACANGVDKGLDINLLHKQHFHASEKKLKHIYPAVKHQTLLPCDACRMTWQSTKQGVNKKGTKKVLERKVLDRLVSDLKSMPKGLKGSQHFGSII